MKTVTEQLIDDLKDAGRRLQAAEALREKQAADLDEADVAAMTRRREYASAKEALIDAISDEGEA